MYFTVMMIHQTDSRHMWLIANFNISGLKFKVFKHIKTFKKQVMRHCWILISYKKRFIISKELIFSFIIIISIKIEQVNFELKVVSPVNITQGISFVT